MNFELYLVGVASRLQFGANTETWVEVAGCSRAETVRGRRLIEEVRYLGLIVNPHKYTINLHPLGNDWVSDSIITTSTVQSFFLKDLHFLEEISVDYHLELL